MRKNVFYLSVIAISILTIVLLSIFTGNDATAWYASSVYGPGLVNAMDPGGLPGVPTPPYGHLNDEGSWQGRAATNPVPVPTPKFRDISAGASFDDFLPGCWWPTNGFLRVTWTGKDDSSSQYIELPSRFFENVGCQYADPCCKLSPGTDPAVYVSSNLTPGARDWTCYEYVKFFYYLNYWAGEPDQGTPPSPVQQDASIFDGAITITANDVNVPALNPALAGPPTNNYAHAWTRKYSVSLRWLSNQYDTVNNRYFSVSNVASFMINAPKTNYNGLALPVDTVFDPGYNGDEHHLIMYYDYLTLGAKQEPNNPPPDVTVSQVTFNGVPVARIQWTVSPQTGTSPPTGYQVYRSQTGPGGPYIPVPLVDTDTNSPDYPDAVTPASASFYIDRGGNTNGVIVNYCYKVLTCDNGPVAGSDTGGDVSKNTITASYHQDFLANADYDCADIDPIPTFTPTFTVTDTPGGTPQPTSTATPVPTDPGDPLSKAYIFPNPFSPNKGSKKFYVTNVPVDTKVSIYAMDGSLVKDDVVKNSTIVQGMPAVIWDGRNKNGSKAVTGLYLLVLEDPKSGKKTVNRFIICYECEPVYKP